MNNNQIIINNVSNKDIDEKYFLKKKELKTILDLYAKWFQKDLGDYGLSISVDKLIH